jgi:hypothetical protein
MEHALWQSCVPFLCFLHYIWCWQISEGVLFILSGFRKNAGNLWSVSLAVPNMLDVPDVLDVNAANVLRDHSEKKMRNLPKYFEAIF